MSARSRTATVSGTPVSEMGDQYQQDTFALAKMIATYVELASPRWLDGVCM